MNKFFKIFVVSLFVLALALAPVAAFAQDAAPEAAQEAAVQAAPFLDFNTLAAALTLIGAAYGIGRIGSTAVESMARQPEVAGSVNSAMIVSAALIEGATFFALIICLLGTLG